MFCKKKGLLQLTHGPLQSSLTLTAVDNTFLFDLSKLLLTIMILTAVKIGTLCDVTVGRKDQFHILDNTLQQRQRDERNT